MFRITSLVSFLFFLALQVNAQVEEVTNVYNSGVEANNAGNIQEAIDNFEKCISLVEGMEQEEVTAVAMAETSKKKLPFLYYQLAVDAAKTASVDEGINQFKKTLDVATEQGDADIKDKATNGLTQLYYKKGVTKYKAKDFAASIEALDKAIAIDENFVNAYYLKTVVYKTQGDEENMVANAKLTAEKAGADSKLATKTNSMVAKEFLKLGLEAKGAAKYDEALSYTNKSVEFNSKSAKAYILLQQIYSSKEDWDSSIGAGKKALSLVTDDDKKAGIYFELGNAYAGKGDTANACSSYKSSAVGKYKENAEYQMQHVLKCQ